MTGPYYHHPGERITLYHGDCLQVMAELPEGSVDSIVTDPPYGLGFMGKAWDDLPPGLPWAQQCLRVLKPGGHLLAFGGTRTWHRLTVAVEDAGFEIRDSIAWLYGSGFPKSLDISKAIDKLDAADERMARAREFQSWLRQYLTPQQVGTLTGTDMGYHLTTHPTQPTVATADMFDLLRPHLPAVPERIEELVALRTVESANFKAREVVGVRKNAPAGWNMDGSTKFVDRDVTNPHTPDAAKWHGWGTALKPAFEPIVVARKSLIGTVASNVLAHGVGGINVDACRVPHAGASDLAKHAGMVNRLREQGGTMGDSWKNSSDLSGADPVNSAGRWPTNVVLDESQAAELDTQTGTLTSGKMQPTKPKPSNRNTYGQDAAAGYTTMETYGDDGGASRFFPTFKYQPKAPQDERPTADGAAHPTVKPLELMRWLCRLVTPRGGVVLDPFAGSGTTVEAALRERFGCIAIEQDAAYLPLIKARIDRPFDLTFDFEGL